MKTPTSFALDPPTTITSFVNGWRSYAGGAGAFSTPARFYKDPFGLVHLEGLIDKNGGNWSSSETFFTLPIGYRPSMGLMSAVPSASNGGASTGLVELRVNPDGTVTLGPYGGAVNPVFYMSIFIPPFRGY